ncbi:PREDICTED: uncharacterized protein LOC105132057 isoform X2 [Populus euphratica]|uniref:Uncharacterized protein LOC105132057 isoform X2 n=1 Tax=Populus euphratica TaxID=75702 RepID=A0AAJ6UQQ7_POPEU|nr:PREDICTED: uncharacterized protein LOC105132057 isoform X2 [Populus euphratica]
MKGGGGVEPRRLPCTITPSKATVTPPLHFPPRFNCSKLILSWSLQLHKAKALEAAGDSEVDSDPTMSTIDLVDDDDDAESCSCDTADHSCVRDIINVACSEVEAYQVNYNVVGGGDDDDEEEEGVEVCQSWVHHVHVGLPVKQKSCVSVDSSHESMNEKEKDKLFWEACLAS